MVNNLALKYSFIKNFLIKNGYQEEIEWQESVCFDQVDESVFLREIAWVILSSGMKESVIRNIFENVSECFFNWISARLITQNKEECFQKAVKHFNNKNKVSAIIFAAEKINEIGFCQLKSALIEEPFKKLQEFPYIGPITVYHLVKNIGLPYAKPDRHLKRIAKNEGYTDVQKFCGDVSKFTGDSKPVVDIVFWRFATITNEYLDILSFFDKEYEIQLNGV